MAKNTQPVLKRCKTLGLSPAVLGYSKSTKRQPKQSRRKQSEYGMQLNEKQKEALRSFGEISKDNISPEEKSFFNKIKNIFK